MQSPIKEGIFMEVETKEERVQTSKPRTQDNMEGFKMRPIKEPNKVISPLDPIQNENAPTKLS